MHSSVASFVCTGLAPLQLCLIPLGSNIDTLAPLQPLFKKRDVSRKVVYHAYARRIVIIFGAIVERIQRNTRYLSEHGK